MGEVATFPYHLYLEKPTKVSVPGLRACAYLTCSATGNIVNLRTGDNFCAYHAPGGTADKIRAKRGPRS